jgi:hypothetical protein
MLQLTHKEAKFFIIYATYQYIPVDQKAFFEGPVKKQKLLIKSNFCLK